MSLLQTPSLLDYLLPLETATYTSDLVTSNPAASDGMNNADDHMRMIKQVVKNTLAGANSTISRTIAASWGFLVGSDGVAATPAYAFASEPALGFFRSGSSIISYTGVLRGIGDAGRVFMHAGPSVPNGSLLCNGAAVSRTTYADLFAAIGTTWGVGDGSTTFNIPDLRDRFPRCAGPTYAGSVGTLQGFQNASHTHAVSGTTASENATHTHGVSGVTSAMSANATHSHNYDPYNAASGGATGGGSFSLPINTAGNSFTTTAANTDHTHTFSVVSNSQSQNHQHTFSATSGTGSADGSEARPQAATLLFCIRF